MSKLGVVEDTLFVPKNNGNAIKPVVRSFVR